MRIKGSRVPDPHDFVSCPGDRFHIEYRSEVQKDGTVKLVEAGKTDIQEFIQSFKDQTDMSYILKQLQLGNLSVLDQRKPIYGDFTKAPQSLAEFQQTIIDATRAFMDLPLDVRNKYDHDVNRFIADIGSKEWLEIMDPYLPKKESPAPVVESEVTADA